MGGGTPDKMRVVALSAALLLVCVSVNGHASAKDGSSEEDMMSGWMGEMIEERSEKMERKEQFHMFVKIMEFMKAKKSEESKEFHEMFQKFVKTVWKMHSMMGGESESMEEEDS